MPDDQILCHEPSLRTTKALINQEPTLITTSINLYETIISDF
ncbi:30851_t:CDS:1, partial [Racocetra persica]